MPQQIIDLSHLIQNDMPTYPGDQAPEIKTIISLGEKNYKETGISMSTHTGTHVDAPSHVFANGTSLDSFPIEKFIGNGKVIDCSRKETIAVDHLKILLASYCPEFLLIHTGWDSHWGTTHYFSDFPALEPEAVRFLESLPLKGIGIDTPSFDRVESVTLPIHKSLLGNEMVLIENLTGLKALLEKQFTFYCLPLKIKDSEGSPVRAIAIFEDR